MEEEGQVPSVSKDSGATFNLGVRSMLLGGSSEHLPSPGPEPQPQPSSEPGLAADRLPPGLPPPPRLARDSGPSCHSFCTSCRARAGVPYLRKAWRLGSSSPSPGSSGQKVAGDTGGSCLEGWEGGFWGRWDLRLSVGPLQAAGTQQSLEEKGSGCELVGRG